jgi:hypothetical protein
MRALPIDPLRPRSAARWALFALALLACAAAPLFADSPQTAALGFSGEIYVARNGSCEELLEHCSQVDSASPVVVVDRLRAGEEPQRFLVPTTDDPQPEGIATLFVEDTSDTVYVVWESRPAPGVSQVNLAWLAGDEWSQVIEVSAESEPLKGPPQVEITRDAFVLRNAAGKDEEHHRTVLHLAWSEQRAEQVEIFYTAIVLEDGGYLGGNNVFNLSRLDPNPPALDPIGLPASLLFTPQMRPGREPNTVIIAFANSASERVLAFESQMVPSELTDLAQQVMEEMLANGGTLTSGNLSGLADRIRSHIVDIGFRFQPGLINTVADSVHSLILDPHSAAGSLPALADRIRSHIVDIGSRMLNAGGLSTGEPPKVDALVSALPLTTLEPPGLVWHALRLRLKSDRPAPAIGIGNTLLFVSRDGTKGLVSWQRAGSLLYRETDGQSWTPVRKIELVGPITAAIAEQMLRLRVDGL